MVVVFSLVVFVIIILWDLDYVEDFVVVEVIKILKMLMIYLIGLVVLRYCVVYCFLLE